MTICDWRPLRRALAAVPAQPWKNLGGTTRELASGDGWRISVADVEADGPFSVFDGHVRHSVVIAGQGLELQRPGERVALRPFEPARYDGGGHPWQSTLAGGAAKVFNVIVRRGAATVSLEVASSLEVQQGPGICLLLPLACTCTCERATGPSFPVRPGEYLLWRRSAAAGLRLTAHALPPTRAGFLLATVRDRHQQSLC